MPDEVVSEGQERAQRAVAALDRLVAARHAGDEEGEHAAADALVELHLGVARALAARYRRRGIPDDDLEQVASLALVRAVQLYEPGRGTAFLAYAVPVIRGELRHHFRDHGWVVRPPRRVQELQGRVVRERDRVPAARGRLSDRLARRLGTTVAEVDEALAAEGCFTPLSLDRPATGAERSGSVGDALPDEVGDGAAEARALLRSPVRRLTERDRAILGMRFFEQLTQQEMAEALGITQTQVSKLLTRILRDLRCDVGDVDDVDGATGAPAPDPVG